MVLDFVLSKSAFGADPRRNGEFSSGNILMAVANIDIEFFCMSESACGGGLAGNNKYPDAFFLRGLACFERISLGCRSWW